MPSIKGRERIVELELALVDEAERRDRDEGLGDARDADMILALHRRLRRDVAHAERADEFAAARNPDADIEAGLALVGHALLDDGDDRGFLVAGEGLGGERATRWRRPRG